MCHIFYSSDNSILYQTHLIQLQVNKRDIVSTDKKMLLNKSNNHHSLILSKKGEMNEGIPSHFGPFFVSVGTSVFSTKTHSNVRVAAKQPLLGLGSNCACIHLGLSVCQ